MFDLELLRSFVSVVDSGGFTRAGERVHRTQSTVSQQIKRLEDDVGQPLLNRSSKDVTPTEAGERGCCLMRADFCRSRRKPATCWRVQTVKVRCGSASPKTSPPIG
jgi:Bacterial regulatory helix-turn-helix protein, lysR family